MSFDASCGEHSDEEDDASRHHNLESMGRSLGISIGGSMKEIKNGLTYKEFIQERVSYEKTQSKD